MTIGTANKIRFAMRKHSRLAYRASRDRDDALVVLLHDLLFTQSVFAGLSTPGLMPDLRGHGASASLANQWVSMTELADDVTAVLDAESAPVAHLVGHGLGGAIAVEFALKYPERVRSLVLIEPMVSALLDNDLDRGARALRGEWRARDRAAGDAAYKGLTDKALDDYLIPRFGPNWRADAAKSRIAAIRRNAGAMAGMLPALDSFTPSRADIQGIAAPVMVLAGPDASPVDHLVVARLASNLPNVDVRPWSFADRLNDPFGGESAAALAALIEQATARR